MAYTPGKDILTSSSSCTPTTTISPFYGQGLDGDPYYDSVVLALHMDGANGGTTFTDSSSYGHSLTAAHNAITSSDQAVFGTSAKFDGDQDLVQAANHSSFALTGDSTLEMFFYIAGNSPAHGSGGLRIARLFGYGSGGAYELLITATGTTTGAGFHYKHNANAISVTMPIPQGEWHHIAAVRSGSELKLFFNGVLVASGVGITAVPSNLVRLGAAGLNYPHTYSFNGYIDDFRLTNGVARYDSDFVVPTEAFPDYPLQRLVQPDPHYNDVALLLHMDGNIGGNNFVDSSINNHAVISYADTHITNAEAVFYHSAYFDGGADSLEVGGSPVFELGENSFTIELFTHQDTHYNANTRVLSFQEPTVLSVNDESFGIELNDTNKIVGFIASGSVTYSVISSQDIPLNQWNHIAFVRTGGELRLYINGLLDTAAVSASIPINFTNTMMFKVGNWNNSRYYTGYIDEVRVTNGYSRYDDNFSTPIAPYADTAPSGNAYYENVTLLLHGDNTNGSTTIIDSSPRDLSLPNSAQISNVNSEYVINGSSIFFNVRDMAIPNNTFDFGVEDFTIEFWIFVGTAQSPYPAILSSDIDMGNNAGFVIKIHGGGTSWGGSDVLIFQATNGGGYPFAMSSVTQGLRGSVWNHVAIVREGKGHRLYINGILEATHLEAGVNNYAESGTNKLNGLGSYVDYSESSYMDEVRITKGVARYAEDFEVQTLSHPDALEVNPAVPPAEAMLGRVSFLMHGEGTDGSTVFTDSSRHDAAATLHGNASISTNTAAIGASSLFLDGLNSRISYPDRPEYHLGDKNFTIEMWICPLSNNNDGFLMCQTDNENGLNAQWMIYLSSSSSRIQVKTATSGSTWDNIMVSDDTVPVNAWTHIALVGYAGDMTLYINGVAQSALVGYAALSDSAWPLSLGGTSTGVAGKFFHGHIDEARIVKDQAIYTDSFTPTYTQFKGREDRIVASIEDISKVTLMLNVDETCGSTIADRSLYKETVSSFGNPTIGNVSVNTDSVSSMYFDGTEDYLSAPASVSNFGTQDFAVEFWIDINLSTTSPWTRIFTTSAWDTGDGLYCKMDGAATGWGGDGVFGIHSASENGYFDLISRTATRGTGWHHIAFSRQGLDIYLFIDGYLEDHKRLPAIGSLDSQFTRFFTETIDYEFGYLDGARITIGEAVYTEDFIPDYSFSLDIVDYDYDRVWPYASFMQEPSKYNLQQRLTFNSGNLDVSMSGDGNTICASYPSVPGTYEGRVYYSKRTSGVWSGWTEIVLPDPRPHGDVRVKQINQDGSRLIMDPDYGTGATVGIVEIYDWDGSDYVRTNYFFDALAVAYASSSVAPSDSGDVIGLNSGTYPNRIGVFSIYDLNGGNCLCNSNTPVAISDSLGAIGGVNFIVRYPVSINEVLLYSHDISRYAIASISNDVLICHGLIQSDHVDRLNGFTFTLDGSNYPVAVSIIDKDGVVSASAFPVSGTHAKIPLVSDDGKTVAVISHQYSGASVPLGQYIDVYTLSETSFSLSYDDFELAYIDHIFTLIHNDETSLEDPYFEDVILLMHMDGVDGESIFTDDSSYQHTMTVSGVVETNGNRLDSTIGGAEPTGHVYGPGGSVFVLGTGDFTYEVTVEINDTSTNSYILTFESEGAVDSAVADLMFESSDNSFRYYEAGHRIISSPILINTSYQVAVTRAAGVSRLFVNGLLQGSYVSTTDLIAGTNSPKIGRFTYTNSDRMYGYIDEVRITKGVARYIEDYTVENAPFPDTGIVTVPEPTPEVTYNFTLGYDAIHTVEDAYAHTFALQYTIEVYGVPIITIADISLSTFIENSDILFRFVYDTELRQEATIATELSYFISHIDDIHEFRLPYEFNKELVDTPYEFRLPYRFGLGTAVQHDYAFNFRFLNTGYVQQEWAHIFGLRYSVGLSNHVNNLFTIRYTSTTLFVNAEYVFDLRSDFGLIRYRDYEFKARYVDASFVANGQYVFDLRSDFGLIRYRDYEFKARYVDASFVANAEYVYHFRTLLSAVEERDTDFNFRYGYDYYIPVSYEFNMQYHMRMANAANPDNTTTAVIPNGNGGADFELEIIDVEMMQGDYVLVVDSGSSYSSFFIKYTVPDTGANIIDMTLYDASGVTIDVSFTDILDVIKFTIRDVDIDSSISISSYGIDNNEFTVMFNEWPNWSSYIHEDLEGFSSLVHLDSGNFKILPLQPNTCCILRSSELCMLPPYSDVDNIALAESLSLDWIEVNTAIWNTPGIAKNCSAGLTEAALVPGRTVSMISAEIIGPGILTFDWMLEATGLDSMWFEVEDLFSEHIQGTQEWESKTIDIPRGRYMIEWFYIKDETSSSPTDISAIDKITYRHS